MPIDLEIAQYLSCSATFLSSTTDVRNGESRRPGRYAATGGATTLTPLPSSITAAPSYRRALPNDPAAGEQGRIPDSPCCNRKGRPGEDPLSMAHETVRDQIPVALITGAMRPCLAAAFGSGEERERDREEGGGGRLGSREE